MIYFSLILILIEHGELGYKYGISENFIFDFFIYIWDERLFNVMFVFFQEVTLENSKYNIILIDLQGSLSFSR